MGEIILYPDTYANGYNTELQKNSRNRFMDVNEYRKMFLYSLSKTFMCVI